MAAGSAGSARRGARPLLVLLLLLLVPSAGFDCPGPRSFIFPAPTPRIVPDVDGAPVVRFAEASGRPVFAIHLPAPAGAPYVVHFHGNGQQIAGLGDVVRRARRAGVGLLAVEYPGYGPAHEQAPSEDAAYAAADAALRRLRDDLGVSDARIVLEGWSLGTGVAVEMARRGFGARVVLLAPYTSIPDVAAHHVSSSAAPIIRDRFDSYAKAPAIGKPVLVIHGTSDPVIPYELGKRLAARFPHADLITLEGGKHSVFQRASKDLVGRYDAFLRGEVVQ